VIILLSVLIRVLFFITDSSLTQIKLILADKEIFNHQSPLHFAVAGELSQNNLRILISKLKYRSNARFQSCVSQHPSSLHYAVTGQSSFHFSLFRQLADQSDNMFLFGVADSVGFTHELQGQLPVIDLCFRQLVTS